MSKLFDALQRADTEPMSQTNGDRVMLGANNERLHGRKVTPLTPAAGTGAAAGYLPALEMDPVARQELTRLTHTVFLRPGGSRIVALSGAEPGVGCSWVTARIGELLASANAGSVCLVDANLSTPTLHHSFNVSNTRGLSEALLGSSAIKSQIQRLGGGLHLLSAGHSGEKAESLLASTAFRTCVEELRTEFDFILFDTPALAYTADGLAVAGRSEGLVLVVEAGQTNRETALRAAKNAAAAHVHVLGLVLNKRTYPVPSAIYNMF